MSDHFFSNNCCTLDHEEVKLFTQKYQDGDNEAALPLIQSQGAWVISMVSHYSIPSRISVDDVYSELVLEFLHGLKVYDPERTALSTFFRMIFNRRISGIIRRLSDPALTSDSGAFIEVAGDRSTQSLEDNEMLAVICDIMHTHLTPFEREVFINYTDDVSVRVVADKANEFIASRDPEAASAFNERSIKPHIDRIIGIIQGELVRRGDIESNASVQSRLF